MHDLWPLSRLTGPQSQALSYTYEKAGLTLHSQPIPWSAEAVAVEAQLRVPPAGRRRTDFTLRLPGREPLPADTLRRDESDGRFRLFFRFPPPARTTTAELVWQGRILGQIELPIIDLTTFLAGLRLQFPTVNVRLGEQTVPCQTFVATQCRGLATSALLASPVSLAPLADLGMRVEFRSERGDIEYSVPVPLCSTQLASRQALLTAAAPRVPRRLGLWTATWFAGDFALATLRARAVSQTAFRRSLRVSDTRFMVDAGSGEFRVCRAVPAGGGIARLGPCFLVTSREPGMAGLIRLQVHAHVPGVENSSVALEQTVLVTDGPTLVAPGMLAADDAAHVSAFELRHRTMVLGTLSLRPVPTAAFTSEGGFRAPADFAWTPTAEDELTERLGKLMEGFKG